MILQLRTILDQGGAYIFTKDAEGRYTYVNQKVQALFCQSFEAIIGKDDSHFFNLELANELQLNDRRVLASGEIIEVEERNIIKDTGEERIYWSVKKPIYNKDGTIIGIYGISTDITERKAMEEALRKSENHLRLSQIVGGIGTWEIDLVNNKQTWSDICTSMLGFSDRCELTWEDFLANIHPEDRQRVIEAFESHIRHGSKFDVDYRLLAVNNPIKWMRSAGQAERNYDGTPIIMRGIVQEVTDRYLAQQRIQQLIEEQTAILENPLVGIVTVRDRKIVWANHAYEDMLGYGKNEVIGLPSRQLYVHERDYQAVGEAYANMERIGIVRAQHEFVRKDGQHIWLDMSGTILHRESGETLWVFVDATDRKQAETQIVSSLSLLKATLDSTNEAILVVDLKNCWVLHNQGFIDLWNIPDEILVSGDDRAALSYVTNQLDDADGFLRKVEELYATPDATSFDLITFKDGKVLERYSIPQRINDEVVGRVWSFRDVTQQKQTLKALRRESKKNSALLHNASDGIHILDPDGRIVELSNSFCAMLGYERCEMIGMDIPSWDVKFTATEIAQSLSKQFKKQKRYQFETRHCRKDGIIIDVEISCFPLQLDDEQLLFCSSRDITERKRAEKQLQDSEQWLNFALETLHAGAWELNLNNMIASRTALHDQIFGYSRLPSNWTYETFLQHVIPEDRQTVNECFKAAHSQQTDVNFDCRIRRSDGEIHWIWAKARRKLDQFGHTVSLSGIVQDISERKQAEEKLHLAASVFTHAREAIMITEPDGTIIDVNDAFTRITGYNREEILGHNPRILRSGLQDKAFYATLWNELLEKGHWDGEIWNRRKQGELYAEMLTISSVCNDQGDIQHYVALFSDITEIKQHEKQLEYIAHYDALTNLPNRVLLADRLHQSMTQAQRYSQSLAVLYLDLDGFKGINDKHGHEVGDHLLKSISARMKQTLRQSDTLARLGGDEFVAVLQGFGDIDASLLMIDRLLIAASQKLKIGDLILQVSASVGVTFYPQTVDVDADQLLRQADQSMYQAKMGGKNRYHVFDTQLALSIRDHHESLDRIHRALAGREFVLCYQPKVDMRNGLVVGVEALIRWQHPQKGLLLPAEFLPIIEGNQLAIEIGEWVIETTLTQIEQWHAVGFDVTVSVNVGAMQLQQEGFVDRLGKMLANHPNVLPSSLEIEVLETSALENIAQVTDIIKACGRIGVSFALDDFGTGYSSLTYLKRLPVATLKIDQSFVRDMLNDPEDLAILDGVLGMARAFGRRVIAEGVETLEHGEMLLQLGCEFAQGYGIGHPMPADDLPNWSAHWHTPPSWANRSSVNRDDLPLLFASVEHRAWIFAMENYLKGISETPPMLDHHKCRFGTWLYNHGMDRYGEEPNFHFIELLHRKIHDLASELCQLRDSGQNQTVPARIEELFDLRNDLVEQIAVLIGTGFNKA